MTPEFTNTDMVRIRTRLLMKQPFLGALATRLKYEEKPEIPTLCTDGQHIWYNADFMKRLSDAEQQGVFVHEVGHCMLLHIFRMGNRDPKIWNYACDYALNPMLIKAGMALPQDIKDDNGNVIFSGVLIDPRFDGMHVEAIYAKLIQEQQQKKPQQGQPKGGGGGKGQEQGGKSSKGPGEAGNEAPSATGDFIPAQEKPGSGDGTGNGSGNGGAESVAAQEQSWKVATEHAMSAARLRGKMPGGFEELIQASRVPKMDPWAVIEQFLVAEISSDFSWTTPNRRMIAQGMYLPGAKKENVGPLVIGIDTSGSATTQMLTEWASNISGLAQKYLPSEVHVVMCDTRVTNAVRYESSEYDSIKFECKGRGGTLFQPVFDWVEEQGINPVALIYFTDMQGPTPEIPEYPVLWAIPEYFKGVEGPFGTTVPVGVE